MNGERTISLEQPASVTLTLAQWNQVIGAIVQTHPLVQAINLQLNAAIEKSAVPVAANTTEEQ